MAKNAISVTEEDAEETGVKDWLEEGGDGKMGELYFGFSRNDSGDLGGVIAD